MLASSIAPAQMSALGRLCAELQLTRTVVVAMIRRGELPATKQGPAQSHPWLVNRADLEAWVDGQRATIRRFVEENPPGFSAMWDPETGLARR